MFARETLDNRKQYLTADYTIESDSPKHRALQVFSAFMVLLYPVGIPLLYALLLFRSSSTLRQASAHDSNPKVPVIWQLWEAYKPERFYYEVVECIRRISLTGVVIFIFPNTAAQVAITIVVAFTFAMVSETFAPYVSLGETWTAKIGHAIVFLTMCIALPLKVDVS